ncbi:DUF6191 domain-containing protein [Streptomyces sp. NPDC012769]|uniref:DUF6191 domain-containing protein n=1 Tax=Streptomyces sp. NPDC012769 TaxID=3364848 RepID=UPI0036827F90
MFNLMEELFAPGRKHTDDERQRLALTREDVGDGDRHKGPIDLASGKVTIRVAAAAEAPAPAGSDGSDRGVEEAEAVGEGGGLATAGDAQLGEDVGDVDARRLR